MAPLCCGHSIPHHTAQGQEPQVTADCRGNRLVPGRTDSSSESCAIFLPLATKPIIFLAIKKEEKQNSPTWSICKSWSLRVLLPSNPQNGLALYNMTWGQGVPEAMSVRGQGLGAEDTTLLAEMLPHLLRAAPGAISYSLYWTGRWIRSFTSMSRAVQSSCAWIARHQAHGVTQCLLGKQPALELQ